MELRVFAGNSLTLLLPTETESNPTYVVSVVPGQKIALSLKNRGQQLARVHLVVCGIYGRQSTRTWAPHDPVQLTGDHMYTVDPDAILTVVRYWRTPNEVGDDLVIGQLEDLMGVRFDNNACRGIGDMLEVWVATQESQPVLAAVLTFKLIHSKIKQIL